MSADQIGQPRVAQLPAERIRRNLSVRLTLELGKGFTETNLKYFRQFYLAFPAQSASGIGHTLCDQLTWSHYRLLMRVDKPGARAWYRRQVFGAEREQSAFCIQVPALPAQRGGIACRD